MAHPPRSQPATLRRRLGQLGPQSSKCRSFSIGPTSRRVRWTERAERTAARPWRRSRQRAGLLQGAPGRKALLEALGAGSVEPIVSYTITAEDVAGPFAGTIPQDMAEMAKLPGLYYTSVLQELGERFHSAPALLKRLNLRAHFAEGETIRVPNVLGAEQAARRRCSSRPRTGTASRCRTRAGAVKVVVSKKASVLMVYDREGQVIFYAPVTSGSEHDPLPLGNWVITSVERNPIYNYNPERFWNADPADAKEKIAAGPNNPVGVVWMGLNAAALRDTRNC